jgi:hypothetical protein
MVTSFLRVPEKGGQTVAKLFEGAKPRVENRSPLIRERVCPLRRPGQVASPFRHHEPVVLERSERPVDVAHVDAIVTRELGKPLQQLVPMGRAVRDEDEERGLAEALDARPNLPAPIRALSAAARSTLVATVHAAHYM